MEGGLVHYCGPGHNQMKQSANRSLELVLLGLFTLLPLFLLALVLRLDAMPGQVLALAHIADLDFALAFRFDGLSLLFAGLITFIGFLIQLYSLGYMAGKPGRLLFHLYLTLFMLSMLGLVMAENLVLLFIFWELTTLTSFLLIGFTHEQFVARRNAVQAAVVTGAGGLCLLAAVVLLGQMAGTYQLSGILVQGSALLDDPLAVPCLLLILLAAFTKSAQFPFHFWLPGAMAAPTPVSAYLHSATMVKAGIYLLARRSPVFSEMDLWFWSLAIAGGVTALWTALMALRQTDLKLMLAYSTNTILGALTLLLATGHKYAMVAAMLLIVAHAFYKASLFMVIGNIDKATGTREYGKLAGLGTGMVITLGCAVIAGLSKAGFPPTFGFLSKEYIYKAGFELGWLFLLVLFLANAIMVCLAAVIVHRPFLSRANETHAKAKPIEHIWVLWMAPLILAIGGILVPFLLLGWVEERLVTPAFFAAAPGMEEVHLHLWEGFSPALLLSLATLATGLLMAWVYEHVSRGVHSSTHRLPVASEVYFSLMTGIRKLSSLITDNLQHGRLTGYLLTFLGALSLMVSYAVWSSGHLPDFSPLANISYVYWSLAALLVMSVVVVIRSNSRLLCVCALGIFGFITTLMYMLYSAPDVAKTQLLVETLLIVFLAIIMRRMPPLRSGPRHGPGRRVVNLAVACLLGGSVTVALLVVTSLPFNSQVPDFYAAQSYVSAHGRNVVNVILVDFRAFDTLGEALVVVVAGLAAWALLRTGTSGAKK